jgi:hypothetical protein
MIRANRRVMLFVSRCPLEGSVGSPDKPSEAKGDGYRDVRFVFDRAAQRVLKRVGGLSQSFGSVTRNVFCLAVEIFGGPLTPIHGSLDLPLRIASCATHAFLDRPAQIPGGACRSMLIHQTLAMSFSILMCSATLSPRGGN